MKQSRTSLVTGLVLTGLLSFVLVVSGIFKLTIDPTMGKGHEMAEMIGIALMKPLAVIEFLLAALLWIPRTSALGFILTFGYFSGATATHLTHSSPIDIQPVLMGLTLLAAFFKTPELFFRLLVSKQPSIE
jgi:DoxX-like family